MAFFFFIFYRFFSQPNPDLRTYFEILPLAFFIFIPAITMRLWSEEKKQGTLEMLMTLPLKTWEVVVGKFLAAYSIADHHAAPDHPGATHHVLRPAEHGWTGAGGQLHRGLPHRRSLHRHRLLDLGPDPGADGGLRGLRGGLRPGLLHGVPDVMTGSTGPLGRHGPVRREFRTFFHYQKFAQGQVSAVDVVYALGMIGLFLGLNNFAVESRKY